MTHHADARTSTPSLRSTSRPCAADTTDAGATTPGSTPSRRGLLVGGAVAAAVPLAMAAGARPAGAAPIDPSAPTGPTTGPGLPAEPSAHAAGTFTPGKAWKDTDGHVIQAHGGQVVVHEDGDGPIYYWYGEDRSNGYDKSPGVHVYSSRDLYEWDDEGLALRTLTSADDLDEKYFADLYADYDEDQRKAVVRDLVTVPKKGSDRPAAILERPKVLFNETTDTWVMWVHADGPTEDSDAQYAKARAGVAVADDPTGPFRWIDSYRLHVAPEGEENYDPDHPGMARDMTLFKDDDGTAYIIYSSEENYSLFISKLDTDYTYLATKPDDAVKGEDFTRPYIGGHREAPAMFKRGDTYYLITSGATGWDPNPASYATATEILGEWTDHGNPCEGEDAATTFGSQSTHVIPLDPDAGTYIYMGDRWTPDDLAGAPYIWLPLTFGEGTSLSMTWQDSWSWEDLDAQPAYEVDADMPVFLRPGSTRGLPHTVSVHRDGRWSREKVHWDGDLDRPGRTTVTGTVRVRGGGHGHGDGHGHGGSHGHGGGHGHGGTVALDFARDVLVVPHHTRYLANAGGERTSDYQDMRKVIGHGLLNSVPDQKHGVDDATGATWGWSGTSATSDAGTDSMDSVVRYGKDGATLRYRFAGLHPGRYAVHACFYEPWPEAGDRAARVHLNGKVVEKDQRFPTTPEVVRHDVRIGKKGEVDLQIEPTTDADVQISWVLVARI